VYTHQYHLQGLSNPKTMETEHWNPGTIYTIFSKSWMDHQQQGQQHEQPI